MLFKRKIIIVIIFLVVIIGGYFGWRAMRGKEEAVSYVTAAVEKGTLIVSVSGSGQVTVLDQVDIKPEVSGDIIALYINKDQEVKAGQLLAELGTKNVQQAIYDAEIALDDAKEKLEDLLSQPNVQSLRQAEIALAQAERDLNEAKESYENIEKILDDTERQAEIALAQAERDLNEAKESYENIEIDTESSLVTAYEDGYNTVAAVFLKLSSYIKDLKDVLGTEQSAEKYIVSYEHIIGEESPFTQRLVDDYYEAYNLFNKNHAFFITVFQDDDRDTIYQLINDTLETTRAISQTLDSARHMFDAVVIKNYKQFTIASHIDKMKPKIESDASAVSSIISSLQRIKDTIDDTIKNTPEKIEDAEWALQSAQEKFDEKKLALEDVIKKRPEKIEDAEWALQSAQEKFDEKKLALEELMAGADPKDIKSQENIVAQKKDALLDAKEKLDSCSIRAPLDGIIAEKNDKIKKGDSVSSNTVLATLITKQKIAEITLNEIDAANVKSGQKATITFDAIDDLTITGEVIEVDTLGTVSQGVVTYNVRIAFDAQDERVKPGMSLSVTIITDVKQDALLVSNSAIKQQGDTLYVQLANGTITESDLAAANISGVAIPTSSLETQPIQIGLANDTMTEVIDGLKEGDLVVTQTITSSSTQNQSQQQSTGFSLPGMGVPSGGSQMKQMRQMR